MSDQAILQTQYCGVPLENPFLLAPSPATTTLSSCVRGLEAGFAGLVFKSLRMHPAQGQPRLSVERNPFGHFDGLSCTGYRLQDSVMYSVEIIAELKRRFPDKMIAASLLADTPAEWFALADFCKQAGVDVLECNFSSRHKGCPDWAAQDGQLARESVEAVMKAGLPVSVKLVADSSSLYRIANASHAAGARGFSAINVMKAIPRVDPERKICPPLTGKYGMPSGYSGPAIKPLALHSMYELATNSALAGASLCGVGGVGSWQDAMDYILLGASCVQICTAVLQYGHRIAKPLTDGLADFLRSQGQTLREMTGAALPNMRAGMLPTERRLPVTDKWECIGCGRCYLSCRDGAAAALDWDAGRRKPLLRSKDCVGCGLCAAVCPVDAIQMVE